MDIEKKVSELIEKPINDLGYELKSVQYVNEDGVYFLRVIIDSNKIICVDDCVSVTKLIDPMLDDVDYIKDSYILDICSSEKGSD